MKWFCLVLVCIAFLVGIFFGKVIYAPKIKSVTESTVLLDKIKDVFKLVFVEAKFNELYTHKDYNWVNLSPFRKSAIIRIQSTVTVGVNMDSSNIDIDEKAKTIRLRFKHSPDILYMDQKLDYYDLHQGTFNSFSPAELTTLQNKAREIIRNKAMESELMQRASNKRDEMINTLYQLVQTMGWILVVENTSGNEGVKE